MDKDNMQFSIGKSLGLASDGKKSIEEYKKILLGIKSQLVEDAKSSKAEIIDGLEKINGRFSEMGQEIKAQQQKLYSGYYAFINQLALVKEPLNDEVLDKIKTKVNEFDAKIQESILKVIQLFDERSAKLQELIAKMEGKVLDVKDEFDKKITEFLAKLKTYESEFADFELGYQFGNAIRVALNDSDSK